MPTVEQLEALLEREPQDTFLNFGLAMALRSEGRPDDALERFERTLALDRDYVPAYFQKARLLAELGRKEDARSVLERGMEAATRAGDRHARQEMSDFLAVLD